MRSKRFFRTSLLLTLAILVPLLLEPLAHAATYVGYSSTGQTNPTCGANCQSPVNNYGVGETLVAPFAGTLDSYSIYVAASSPAHFIVLTMATVPSAITYSCSPGSGTCAAISDNQGPFTVRDSQALTLTTNTFDTVVLGNPVPVTAGQYIAIVVTQCASACVITNSGPGIPTTLDTCFNFGTNTPSISSTFNTKGTHDGGDANCLGLNTSVIGGTFSAAAGTTATVTQCYGNCGSPPITLANTNSTHTINFNQTITLLYEFQSNLNGFVKNYSLNYAALCGSGNKCVSNTIFLALYTIPSCPLGSTPFSAQCPGFRVSQASYSPPTKARLSGIASSVAVFNGQWIGVAVSATFSGIDVNDTNTNVNLFQTNEGTTPPSISQAIAVTGTTSKMGLWAWITGNVVTGTTIPSPSSGACGPGLDFILACAVNSLCTIVTTQCQTASSIFLIVVLTIFSIAVMLGIFSYWLPGMNITTKGMGEFAVLIFVGWFVTFAAYGLLLPYLIILMFFVIAWLFLGRSRGTGPI